MKNKKDLTPFNYVRYRCDTDLQGGGDGRRKSSQVVCMSVQLLFKRPNVSLVPSTRLSLTLSKKFVQFLFPERIPTLAVCICSSHNKEMVTVPSRKGNLFLERKFIKMFMVVPPTHLALFLDLPSAAVQETRCLSGALNKTQLNITVKKICSVSIS